jgi:hypothetical protein
MAAGSIAISLQLKIGAATKVGNITLAILVVKVLNIT